MVRQLFIKRAEVRGVPWTELVQKYKNKNVFQACEAWKHAIENKYRFYSYGDACFIECREDIS